MLKESLLNDFPREQNDDDCLFPFALSAFLEDGNVQLFFFIKVTAKEPCTRL